MKEENDLYFGFKAYSKTISDILSESLKDNQKSLTVGIFGEWGSGKSKLLSEIRDSFKEDDTIVPVWFNAWRFEKEEHIIIPILKSAFYEIANNKTFLEKAQDNGVKTLKSLFSLFYSTTKGIANSFSFKDSNGVSLNTKELFKEVDKMPENIKNIFNDDVFQYESMYFNFHKSLESITQDVKILFLIDDLDRCLPENSLKVLESIKLFLDIPGCAFVLALDDGVVEKGVSHHYREYDFENNKCEEEDKKKNIAPPISGSEYLEKMVNIPFKLPNLINEDVEDFLKKYFENKIEKNILDIFTKSIPPVPRKLIRVAELFKTKQKLARNLFLDLDDAILAKFVILEILAPEIYRYGVGEFSGFYERLHHWKIEYKHLFNINSIKESITKSTIAESEKSKDFKLLALLENLRDKRGHFEINRVIEKISYEEYKIYLTFAKTKEPIHKDELKENQVSSEDDFIKNLISKDPVAISSAFRDEGFKMGQDKIPSNIITKLLKQKEKLSFEWFDLVKDYLGNEDFKKLIKASRILSQSMKDNK